MKPEIDLQIRRRPTQTVALEIPLDTLASLESVAETRDMSYQALMKFYIGQGLRHDLAMLFLDRVLATTAEVLGRHIPADDESPIIEEIRDEPEGRR